MMRSNSLSGGSARFVGRPLARLLGAVALGVVVALSPAVSAQEGAAPVTSAPSLQELNSLTGGLGGGTCYNRQQATAYETMRVHTQLMMASLGCGSSYGLSDAYNSYRQFTATHAGVLLSYQGIIEAQLGDRGFDDYRTVIANEESQLMIDLGTTGYCRSRQARFESLIGASASSIQDYLNDLGGRLHAQQVGCG